MSQSTVFEFLEKNKPRKFTSKELSENLGIGLSTISLNLRRLRTRKDIEYHYIEEGMDRYYLYWVE